MPRSKASQKNITVHLAKGSSWGSCIVRGRVIEKHGLHSASKSGLEIGKARVLLAEGTTGAKPWKHDSVWSAWDMRKLLWAVRLEGKMGPKFWRA